MSLTTRIANLEQRTAKRQRTSSLTATLPAPHAAQEKILNEASRFNVVALGRRAGKTELGKRLLIEPAAGGKPTAWFSPSYRMLIDVWRSVRSALYDVAERISEAEHRIDLRSGGVIEMWSLERADAVRGRRYGRVIIDEAAMLRDLGYAWSTVIRPTLVDLEGDAYFFSTPKGRNGFWQLWQQAAAGGAWARWQMPSSVNPHLPPAELEAMRRQMPERVYAQEVEAQFLDDQGAVFRKVQACATAEALSQPAPNANYAFGVDWASGSGGDATVIVVIDMDSTSVVQMWRSNTHSPSQSLSMLGAMYETWRPVTIVVEKNSLGIPLVEQCQRQGLPVQPFTTTNSSKAQIIDSLALSFENETIAILDDMVLIGELMAYEAKKSALGAPVYSSPAGQHDDSVMALALAYFACARQSFLVWGIA